MSAALEGALEGIPSVGFSLLDYAHDADFSEAETFIRKVTKTVLDKGISKGVCLNVNIPKLKENQAINGIKICRQAKANWEEQFEKRIDPKGRSYYWLTGKFVNYDSETDTDEWALANHYVSIVPVQFDITAYSSISSLSKIFSNNE